MSPERRYLMIHRLSNTIQIEIFSHTVRVRYTTSELEGRPAQGKPGNLIPDRDYHRPMPYIVNELKSRTKATSLE